MSFARRESVQKRVRPFEIADDEVEEQPLDCA